MTTQNKLLVDRLLRTMLLIFAIFLYAITFNLLLRPAGIVIGGMAGLSMVLNHLSIFNISQIIFCLSLFFIILGYLLLDKKIVIQTIIAAFLYPLFILLTYNISDLILINYHELEVISLFAGIMLGVSNGLVEKTGFLSGGTDILQKILVKYIKISTGVSFIIIEGSILLLGLIYFKFDQFMYAVLIVYIVSLVGSQIMLSISQNKMFYIYTDEVDEIKNFIHNKLGYDVTMMINKRQVIHHRYILMSVVNTADYFLLRNGIEELDPDAKIIIFDSYEHFERMGKNKERIKRVKEARDEHF